MARNNASATIGRPEFAIAIDSDILDELVWVLRRVGRENCRRPGWDRGRGPTCRSPIEAERLDSALWCVPCEARQAIERYERERSA